MNLMLTSEGDGEEAGEEQEEEDEDDEMQSGLSDQDVDNNEGELQQIDSEAQLGKFHHEYKKKDAEINLDGDFQSLAQADPNSNGAANAGQAA